LSVLGVFADAFLVRHVPDTVLEAVRAHVSALMQSGDAGVQHCLAAFPPVAEVLPRIWQGFIDGCTRPGFGLAVANSTSLALAVAAAGASVGEDAKKTVPVFGSEEKIIAACGGDLGGEVAAALLMGEGEGAKTRMTQAMFAQVIAAEPGCARMLSVKVAGSRWKITPLAASEPP
jgi:hypothetical protein